VRTVAYIVLSLVTIETTNRKLHATFWPAWDGLRASVHLLAISNTGLESYVNCRVPTRVH